MNQLNWTYIRDNQPEHDEMIVQCEPPFEGHYYIGIRKYYQTCTWQQYLDECKRCEMEPPDFWWISAKDFPFPMEGVE